MTRRLMKPQEKAPVVAQEDDWFATGEEAAASVQEEKARRDAEYARQRERGYMPFRYKVMPGETGEIVVLDQTFGVSIHEHNLQDPKTGKWSIFEACPKNWEPCPLCEKYKESSSVIFLSVIDLRPYTNSKGIEVPHSKKLFAIKEAQLPAFQRLLQRRGNFRGLVLSMARDGKKTAGGGMPEYVDKLSEEEIIARFGHDAVFSTKDPTVMIKAENADCYPYDYRKILGPKPSADDLRKRYGGSVPVGSKTDLKNVWDDEEDSEDVSFEAD